jgi:poly-gamma-glutamate synthesis protein (capsule biosynthesis protein)
MSATTESMTFQPDGNVLRVRGDMARSQSNVLVAGDWASCRCYADAAERSPVELYGPLAADILGADLSIVSLECALAGDTPVLKEGPNLKGTPESPQALRTAGFDLATLGNNHTADFGEDGLIETVSLCEVAGLATVGAGREPETPVVRDLAGTRFGVLNLAEPEGPEPDRPGVHLASAYDHRVSEWVRRLKADCDVAMVVIHGGREYVPVPPIYWYDLLLAVADAGADIIVAHHPHVPHGGAIRRTGDGREVPIFFSTGNFIFRPAVTRPDQVPPHTADGYMVRLGLADGEIAGVELIPYRIDGGDGVRPIANDEIERFAHMMRELSAELTDRERMIAWYDTIVEFQWERHYRERFEGFTRKWLDGDLDALRWVRSHHSSPTHSRLIDRALMRIQDGSFGGAPVELTERLEHWYAGTWPCEGFGETVQD